MYTWVHGQDRWSRVKKQALCYFIGTAIRSCIFRSYRVQRECTVSGIDGNTRPTTTIGRMEMIRQATLILPLKVMISVFSYSWSISELFHADIFPPTEDKCYITHDADMKVSEPLSI